MTKKRADSFAAVVMTAVMAAGPALAEDVPYFRLRMGQGAGTPAPAPTPPDGIKTDSLDLAFASADPIPSGTTGTPVNATYRASGGQPPYAMTLVSAPAGIALNQVSSDTYRITGALRPAGQYPDATVRLTDATGAVALAPVPLTVTDSAPGQATALAFASSDPIPSGRYGTRVHSYYTATGGKQPYAMSVANVPPGVTLSQVASDTWAATGSLGAVGSFPDAVVTLTDASSGNPVPFATPLTVSGATSPLSVDSAQDFPASFATYSVQSAQFSVSGGVPPYSYAVTQAPSTVVANDGGDGTGILNGIVENPGTYTGMTVTVTDSLGATASRVLSDFSVTDGGTPALTLTGLDPLPAAMKVGDTAISENVMISGTADPDHYVYGTVLGASGGPYDGFVYQPDFNGTDPVRVVARFAPSKPGTYDLSVVVTDYDDPNRKKLVHWGTTTVTQDPFVATGQFPSTVTGVAGSTTTVYGRVKNPQGNVTASSVAPDGENVQAYYQTCGGYYGYCDPASGVQPGENLVSLTITFPNPGTYQGVRAIATDSAGQKVFFEPVTLVSTAPPPLVKVSEFPNPFTVQGSLYGASINGLNAFAMGGSQNTYVDVQSAGINLYGGYSQCVGGDYQCQQANVPQGDTLVALSGYAQGSGTYDNVLVTVTDPATNSSVTFAPFTVVVTPPPIQNCQFSNVTGIHGTDRITTAAITFQGGQAPFTVTPANLSGVTYGNDTGTDGLNHSLDATMAGSAQTETGHVVVTDAAGGTCEADVTATSYVPGAAGSDVSIVVMREQVSGGYNSITTSYAVQSSDANSITTDWGYQSYDGPTGPHPDSFSVHLGFRTSDGATATDFTVASTNAPDGLQVLGKFNSYDYGDNHDTFSVYTRVLNGTGAPWPLKAGDYTYTFYVFFNDGTYRLTAPYTVHAVGDGGYPPNQGGPPPPVIQ